MKRVYYDIAVVLILYVVLILILGANSINRTQGDICNKKEVARDLTICKKPIIENDNKDVKASAERFKILFSLFCYPKSFFNFFMEKAKAVNIDYTVLILGAKFKPQLARMFIDGEVSADFA